MCRPSIVRLACAGALAGYATVLASQLQAQPAPIAPPQAAPAPSPNWQQLPRMQLERQFAGPLQDTIVQRWRDPIDGTICYIYLPITAPHSTPTALGYVQYGPNIIGSISCLPAEPTKPVTRAAVPPPRRPDPAHPEPH